MREPIIFIDTSAKADAWLDTLKPAILDSTIIYYTEGLSSAEATIMIIGEMDRRMMPEDLFLRFPNIKHIVSLWAGVDRILTYPHIPVSTNIFRLIDNGLTQAMTEYAVGYVMYNHLNMRTAIECNKHHVWRYFQNPLANQQSIGVMGLGVIGGNIAKQLHHIGFNVKAYSRTQKNIDDIAWYGEDDIQDFLHNINILMMVLPSTAQTYHIMNKKTLSYLPKHSVIINLGRGSHIDDDALVDAINTGHLKGAVLDVFNEEPLPPAHPFWSCEAIHITPHNAGPTTFDAVHHVASVINALKEGIIPNHCLVNREHGY